MKKIVCLICLAALGMLFHSSVIAAQADDESAIVNEIKAVPFSRVKLIYCDTSMTPDQGVTSGSQSHPANFNQSNLAQAGATARQALLQLASKQLGVSVEELLAKDGIIGVKSDPSRNVSYGQLIGGKKFDLKLDVNAKRKPPSEWTG